MDLLFLQVDSESLLIVKQPDADIVFVQPEPVFVHFAERGPPGASLPPGGSAGQIATIDGDGVTRIWADPAVSGATPADIANVTAFAAANG